ncbi:MOSC domain-containing protein [bacterium]|nr:MAG: MOSC domain-containing protein [bacterium]
MRVLSVNVGLPREMVWKGREFSSGIAKSPVAGRIMAGHLNLAGDRQADLVNHGGSGKAMYAYPVEHYPFWEEFFGRELPMGALGENLTIEGLTESASIGDRFEIGGTVVVITQPREPCFKLAALHEREEVVAAFLKSGRCGFYLAVEREGEIGAGDEIVPLARDPREVSIAALNALLRGAPIPTDVLERALELEVLPEYWRAKVAVRLAKS